MTKYLLEATPRWIITVPNILQVIDYQIPTNK